MWLVCQIGAREHYGIARGLQRAGLLGALVTDFWVPPGSMAGRLPGAKRLADRFHPDLARAAVHAPNARMLGFELLARLRKQGGWPRILARNALFQREALKILSAHQELPAHLARGGDQGAARPPRPSDLGPPTSDLCLFSYSYAALELFRYAKRRGWKTVLGQIDPGPGEDAIVRRLRAQHPEWAGPGETSPPDVYWDAWREECALADRIVVNSAWSRTLLIDAGIEAAKIEVVPLAFESRAQSAEGKAQSAKRKSDLLPLTSDLRSPTSDLCPPTSDLCPSTSDFRPLRVLWLGQVNVRKGIQDLVAAARMLENAPEAARSVDAGTGCENGGGQAPPATVERASCPDSFSNELGAAASAWPAVPVRIDVVGPHGSLPTGLPGNMVFHGAVPRSEAAAWYAQADVFVLPTHSDGFALTQLEAMAHGLPVIATPCCGEVVEEGVNGWLVPAGDPQALAERIRQIARHPQCLEPMRQAAQASAGKFGIERMARSLLESL